MIKLNARLVLGLRYVCHFIHGILLQLVLLLTFYGLIQSCCASGNFGFRVRLLALLM